MKSDAFSTAYTELNPEQKRAVDTIEGPVMVVAGPGTGKTQILTLRIANILLKTDTQPENILALTFTENGAHAMRARLKTYIGSRAYRIPIHTFHGFAETLIREYPDAYERVIGGRPATDVEKIDCIQSILDAGEVTHLRPHGDPTYYTRKIEKEIQDLKREYITPDALGDIIARQETELADMPQYHEKGAHAGKVHGAYAKKEKSIEKNKELLHVYRRYEALLDERHVFDFEDMIVETVRALEQNEDMLRDLQERYQYLLADEHQDVNGSQNRILDLLASYHERPNIFVVGDEKQAIFRFQGASLENFLYFEDRFPDTVTIALTGNYRSGQEVLDVAHELIAVSDGALAELRVPLVAVTKDAAVVTNRAFTHEAVEDAWVVHAAMEAIQAGTSPEEIAVIVRTNAEVEQYTLMLRKAGIAARPSADSDIFSHPITTTILALIEATAAPERESALFTVLHGPYWGINVADIVRLCSSVRYRESLTSLIADEERLQERGIVDVPAVMRVGTVLQRARETSDTIPPHRVLETLLKESGLLDHVLKHATDDSVRIIRRLYDEIESMVVRNEADTLADVIRVLKRRKEYGLPLNAPFVSSDPHAVQVMTVHKSKGLEFDTVIVPHGTDTRWGGGRQKIWFDIPRTRHGDSTAVDSSDDERRLLYVALTRAKRTLYLSHSAMNTGGRELTPSRLIEAIPVEMLPVTPTDVFEESFTPTGIFDGTVTNTIDASLFTSLLLERGLSATALNNYLKSPWNYLYRNLLRIPEVQTLPLLFGNAVHYAVDRMMQYVGAHEGMHPSDARVDEYLRTALERQPLSEAEYAALHEKGLIALTTYSANSAGTLPSRMETEFSVRALLPTGNPDLPEIPLTGKLDRLDFDAEGAVIRVIDYKTGKPKSRNVIEGRTKDSNGDYKRQLVFYALLLSLLDDERYQTREATLIFLEPGTNGAIREESFTITDEEIAELRAEIIRVVGEISDGSAFRVPCDSSVCEYCDLAHTLNFG